MTSEGNRRLLELVVQIKNDFSGVDAIICCSTKMKSVHLVGTHLTFAYYHKASKHCIGGPLELVSKELNHLAAILHFYAGGFNFMK